MNIRFFSPLWLLFRALDNLALALSARRIAAVRGRAAEDAAAWRAEARRCYARVQFWLAKYRRELADPIPASRR